MAIFWRFFGIFSDNFSQLNHVVNIYIIFHFHIWWTWSHSGCLTQFLRYGISPKGHIYWTQNYRKFRKFGVFFTNCDSSLCLMGANQLFSSQVIFIAIELSQKNICVGAHTKGTFMWWWLYINFVIFAYFPKFPIFRPLIYVPYVCHTNFSFTS